MASNYRHHSFDWTPFKGQMFGTRRKRISEAYTTVTRNWMECESLRIVLIGKTGSGKSSSGNTILGKGSEEVFKTKPSPNSVTKVCQKAETEVDGRYVSVVDTPGLFDTTMSGDEVNKEMMNCISLLASGPHVFLLVIQIGRFTEEEKKTLTLIEEGFGKEAKKFTIILFTHGDKLENDDMTIEEYIEKKCDESFMKLISECGNRYHVFNNYERENHTQVKDLMKKIDDLVKKNGGDCYTNDMLLKAKMDIIKELRTILKDKEEEFITMEDEMIRAREKMERKHKEEIEKMKQKLDEQKEEIEKQENIILEQETKEFEGYFKKYVEKIKKAWEKEVRKQTEEFQEFKKLTQADVERVINLQQEFEEKEEKMRREREEMERKPQEEMREIKKQIKEQIDKIRERVQIKGDKD